jgi:hypothetical protein
MNWGQVKKINSDLSTPLNDLIDATEIGTRYTNKSPITTYVTTTDADWTTVIDVEGNGMSIVGFRGQILTARITVDNVVLHATPDNTNFLSSLICRVYGAASLSNKSAIVENYGAIFNRNNDDINPNPSPIPLGAVIGFKSSFKFEIRRNTEASTNVTGMAVIIA